MSKGSDQRPGKGYQESHERIMPTPPKHCAICGYLPSWCKCVATDKPLTRPEYDRRRFERD